MSSIGDVAIAPSDPMIVWAGTGEANNRQSSSWGNGVYKSTDGGTIWQNMGLKDSHHIGRILIHPANPEIGYVASLGRLWGTNKERGLFKTSDGGKNWKQVLFVNEDTGVVDALMDPASPDTLYVAAYQRRRTVFGFFVGSGPDGGIHKSTDGGQTWKKLAKGLPWNPSCHAPGRARAECLPRLLPCPESRHRRMPRRCPPSPSPASAARSAASAWRSTGRILNRLCRGRAREGRRLP